MMIIKYFLTAAFVFSTIVSFGQKAVSANQDVVSITPLVRVTCVKTIHDFGKIPQDTPVNFAFQFKNEGRKALIINDVSTPCGCTTPMFDKDKPFKSGKSAPINITFNAASVGVFEKTVTVTYNGSFTMDLTIKGEVLPVSTSPEIVTPIKE